MGAEAITAESGESSRDKGQGAGAGPRCERSEYRGQRTAPARLDGERDSVRWCSGPPCFSPRPGARGCPPPSAVPSALVWSCRAELYR
jgi:hypothetical protein